jgi:hypothetical protein
MGEGAEGGMGEGESDVAAGGIPTTSGFEEKGFSCRRKTNAGRVRRRGLRAEG